MLSKTNQTSYVTPADVLEIVVYKGEIIVFHQNDYYQKCATI